MTDQLAETIARLLAELVRDVGENQKAIDRVESLLRRYVQENPR